MADPSETPVNTGEQTSDTTASLPASSETQFRVLSQRLDTLTMQVAQIAQPPQFRIADVVQLLVIVVGIAVAGLTALGFSQRLTDIVGNLGEAERRLTASLSATELRLQSKLDKLSDQFTSMDERTSRLEGEKSITPPPEQNPKAH
jgi:hypothetical protein